jgi:type I restriction enzyme S subunit
MSSDWRSIRLAEVTTKIGSGQTPRGGKDVYKGGEYALIRSQNVYNDGFSASGLAYIDQNQAQELSNVEVRSGDVLLNITGDSVARCCGVPQWVIPARVNQHVCILRADPAYLDSGFLRYFIVTPSCQGQLLSLASGGATRNALTKGMLDSLEIIFPSLPDQKAIAHILGTLDDKIELNRKNNETLEAMAKALFKSWFVDFDPVSAKAEGRPAGLPAEFSDLFPDSFEDSELGEIPSGWRVMELGMVSTFLNGYAFKSSDWQEHGVPVVKIGSVKPGFVDVDNVSFVSDEIAVSKDRYRLSPGDILIGMTGYVGEVGLVPISESPPLLNQRVGRVAPMSDAIVSRSFLYNWMRTSTFKDSVEVLSHGSAQANVSSDSIQSIPHAIPSSDIESVCLHLRTDIRSTIGGA